MSVSLYSQSASPLGTSIYRFVGVAVPAQFIPTLVFSAKSNNAGTNNWVKVNTKYPLISEIDGVNTETNAFVMTTEFSALQSVIADTERERIFDEHVAFLVAHKLDILDGKVI